MANFFAYGVQLFFIISGYTIFMSLYKPGGGTMQDVKRFFIRRLFIIYLIW